MWLVLWVILAALANFTPSVPPQGPGTVTTMDGGGEPPSLPPGPDDQLDP
jgi:hypothetical protein